MIVADLARGAMYAAMVFIGVTFVKRRSAASNVRSSSPSDMPASVLFARGLPAWRRWDAGAREAAVERAREAAVERQETVGLTVEPEPQHA